jgi:hypothetical protein
VREGHNPSIDDRPWSGLRGLVLVATVAVLASTTCNAQEEETDDLRFEGYPDAPAFEVVARKDELFFYPCSQCHEFMEPSGEIRELMAPHEIELVHGRGRLWCTSCHGLEDRDHLMTLLKEPVDFDDAYLVCGGCHANRHKDWTYGAHGKRLENWQGERVLYSCTHCHNAHDPAIKPRAPKAAPPVRAGLERQQGLDRHSGPVWNEQAEHEEPADE